MNSNEEILDLPEKKEAVTVHTEKRVHKDLMIVIGVFFLLLALFFFYSLYTDVSNKIQRASIFGYSLGDLNWGWILLTSSPELLYGSFLFIGALGLFKRAIWGWTASLAISVYGSIFPLVIIVSDMIHANVSVNFPFWLICALILGFGSVASYLLLKPTRSYFKPSFRSYIFAGASIFFLILHMITLPLIY